MCGPRAQAMFAAVPAIDGPFWDFQNGQESGRSVAARRGETWTPGGGGVGLALLALSVKGGVV